MEGTTMAELKVCGIASSRERKGREGERGRARLGGGTAGGAPRGSAQPGLLVRSPWFGLNAAVREKKGNRKEEEEKRRERKEKKKGRKKRKEKIKREKILNLEISEKNKR
jgi:hypothetical protein